LCVALFAGAISSCKEKQKPPDFKKDTSGTVLFKKDDSVKTVSVERIVYSSFQRFITADGVVKPGPKFPVNCLFMGKIDQIQVEEGQDVQRDQTLCELDKTTILLDLQHQAAVVEYRRERLRNLQDSDAANLESAETRESARLLKAEEARLRILENQLEHTRIKSPADGRVYRIFVRPGEVVPAGAPVAEILDISQVSISADMHQEDLASVKKGMRVEVRLRQDPRQVFLGEVVHVDLEADPQSHRFAFDVSLANLQEKFLPGMEAEIKIKGPFMKNVILIPKSAVKKERGELFVFVTRNSHVELQKVSLGPESDGKWIIRSGLKAGEQIVANQVDRLSDGDKIEIAK
jgi:RND family efflux transporter MFP subunit